jgi:hypothetical protein
MAMLLEMLSCCSSLSFTPPTATERSEQTLPGFASVTANNNGANAKHLRGNTAKVKNVFFAQFVEGNAANAVGSKGKHLSHTTHSKRRARTQRFNALCTEAPCAPS